MKKHSFNPYPIMQGLALVIALVAALFNGSLHNVNAKFQSGGAGRMQEQALPELVLQVPLPSDFGEYRMTSSSYHVNKDVFAVDFNWGAGAEDANALVLAAADGVVIKTETNCATSGYGCEVVIGHALGYQTRYSHLAQPPLVQKDVFVAQGTPLGLLGKTGGTSTGEHLHFAEYYCTTFAQSSTTCSSANLVAVQPNFDGMVVNTSDGVARTITSGNYAVGYERFNSIKQTPATLIKHPAILNTYQQYGGQSWVFGLVNTPVTAYNGLFYQKFGPNLTPGRPWYGMDAAIVEYNNKGYFLVGPIWDKYYADGGPGGKWGAPVSDSYEWNLPGGTGYRNDFANGSIVWFTGGGYEYIDASNASWTGQFFALPNNFTSPVVQRRDKYLDFLWAANEYPAPLKSQNGFSAKYQIVEKGFISLSRISVPALMGNLVVKVNGNTVLTASSPNSIQSFESSLNFGIGDQNIEVWFWQDAGKKARIWLTSTGIIPVAFASDGSIASSEEIQPASSYAEYPALSFDESTTIGNPTLEPPTTPPPSGTSIEVLSSSSHTVQPGEKFNPSITVRVGSGTLDPSRGDHLHSIPEDQSNTLGAWPVQPIRSYVTSGGTYTFDVGNDSGFQMTAPSTPGTYQSVWQIRVNGNHIGDQAVIRVTVVGPNHAPGSPIARSPGDWSEVRSQQAPELCWDPVTDPDGDPVEYFAEIHQSAVLDNSGWISGTCWRPNNIAGQYYGYQWHVKARDNRGGESGFGNNLHFTLSPPPYDPQQPTSTPQFPANQPIVSGYTWSSAYLYRRPIVINSNQDLKAGMIIKVDGFDLETLVSAGKMRADHNDLRVVRRLSANSWQEVARAYYSGWDVEFRLLTDIYPGSDTSYYLYYGNPNAGTPPTFSMPNGWYVDMYLDKWWSSWGGTWEFNQAMDFGDVCSPPLDHDGKVGSSFDDSDKYRSRIYIPATGAWTFSIYTGDGYQLYIDDMEVGRFDGYDSAKWYTLNPINLTAGWHKLEARDMWVGCSAWKLAMSGPGFSNQIVPANYFQKTWGNVKTGVNLAVEELNAPPTNTPTATPSQTPSNTPTKTPTPTITPTRTPTQQPKPDLVPNPLVFTPVSGNALYAEADMSINWSYKNIGGAEAGPHRVDVWIGSKQMIAYPFDWLGAGQTDGFATWYEHWDTPGTFTVKIVVDPSNQVAESNETNNTWTGQVTWLTPPPPETPGNLVVGSGTGSTLTMTWNDVKSEKGYRIYRWGYSNATNLWGFYYLATVGQNTTSFTDTGLDCKRTYYYEVVGYNAGGESPHTYNSSRTTALCGDEIDGPLKIDSLPASLELSTESFTVADDDPDFPNCWSTRGNATVWFEFTPDQSGKIILDTFNSSYDTILAGWTGTRGALQSLGCNDQAGGGNQSQLVLTVTAGQRYYIEVAEWTGGLEGATLPVTRQAQESGAEIAGNLKLNLRWVGKANLLSNGTQDGWILESSEFSKQGGTSNTGGTTILVGDSGSDQQYRAVLSFNTGSLPDNAVLLSAILKIKQASITGTNPFATHQGLRFDMRSPYFGTGILLAPADFQAGSTLASAGQFEKTIQGGWYVSSLSPTAMQAINILGATQFRLYFTRDDNDDLGQDTLAFYSGNHSLNTSRPVLFIEYYLP